MLTRKQLLRAIPAALISLTTLRLVKAASPLSNGLSKALDESDLVYITPLKSNGEESHCHAEVWFVHEARDIYVVTPAERWRAEAIRQGLNRARLWVGDYGVWTKSKEKYRQAPAIEATATLENDPQLEQRLLHRFGKKYRLGWIVYGHRFRKGLADGSRVLLHYSLA